MADNKPNAINEPVASTTAPPPQQRWFCVGLSPTGEVFRNESDSPETFINLLNSGLVSWVDVITDDFNKEAPTAAARLGFSESLAASLIGEQQLNYQDLDKEMGLKLPSIQIRGFEVTIYPLVILMRKNFVMTIHPHNVDRRLIRLRRYADTFIRKIKLDTPPQDKLTIVLHRLIGINNDSNFRHLRQIEEEGDELNQDLMNPETPRDLLGPKIYTMKHSLIVYLDGLWQSVDVIHALRFGDAELITDDETLLDRIDGLANAVNNQIGLAEHMSEVLASGLEVLQSIYNNQLQVLNNRLSMVITYLTIIGTAFLVPNTIATIMGNSAFEMTPNDVGWYVTMMVGSTILATAVAWIVVKRLGWLPKQADAPDSKKAKRK
jgi:magnesium transporter